MGIRHRSARLAFHSARIHSSTLAVQATAAAPAQNENAAGANVSINRLRVPQATMTSARPPKAIVACAAWKRTSSSRRYSAPQKKHNTNHPR
jgi:hypothetical protein